MEKKSVKTAVKKSSKKTPPIISPTGASLVSSPQSEISVDKEINIAELSDIKLAAARVGIGLDDYLTAIKDALSAEKFTFDKYGERFSEEDHDKRLKAALLGLEVEGYIKAKGTTTDNSKHTHVTYSWQPVQVINNLPEAPTGGRIDVD